MAELCRRKLPSLPEWAEREEHELLQKWRASNTRLGMYGYFLKYASDRYKNEVMSKWPQKAIENGKKYLMSI